MINRIRYKSFRNWRYHLTWGVPKQMNCSGYQKQISVIIDMNCYIFHGDFNRIWIFKVQFLHLWCCILLRKVIRNNVNRNNILFWMRNLKMPVIQWGNLIRCWFPAMADPVIKGAYCNAVFTASVSIYYITLTVFIELHHLDASFTSSCHN